MDISKISKQYMRQQLFLTAALFLATLLVMQVRSFDGLLTPAIVGSAFTLVVAGAIAMGSRCQSVARQFAYIFYGSLRLPSVAGSRRDVRLLPGLWQGADVALLPGVHGVLFRLVSPPFRLLRQSV